MEREFNRIMYKTLDNKLEDINTLLPETDFVAVFGTSHTSGYCERNGKKELELEQFWSEQLSNKLGIPVINFSLIGNNNMTIVQQLTEFCGLARSNHCRLIICETRIAEHVLTISNDYLTGFEEMKRTNFLPQLSENYVHSNLMHESGSFKQFPTDTVHNLLLTRIPVTLTKLSKDHQVKYLVDSHPGNETKLPNWSYKSISNQLKTYQNHVMHTMQPFIDDYNYIKLMNNICNIKGIKFKWFCWDINLLMDETDNDYKLIKRAFKQTSTIFETEISGLKNSVVSNFKSVTKDLAQYKCNCGHWDETVHEFVATKIHESLE